MAKIEPKRGRPKKNKIPTAHQNVKIVVMPYSSAVTKNATVVNITSSEVRVKCTGWHGFNRIREVAANQIQKVTPPKEASNTLHLAHTMIIIATRKYLGISYQIRDEFI